MPDGLITPELVLQVAEATEDYRITATEFSEIMGTISSIVAGVFTVGAVGMLIAGLAKKLSETTR